MANSQRLALSEKENPAEWEERFAIRLFRVGASSFFCVRIEELLLLGLAEDVKVGAKLRTAEEFDDGTFAFELVDVDCFPNIELRGVRAEPAPVFFC